MKSIQYITDDINYVFDVDGTLTPSRQIIDEEFSDWFYEWCQDKKVFLVTGSDYEKTEEQLGDPFAYARISYNCCGNSIWADGLEVYRNNWKLNENEWQFLEMQLLKSNFTIRTGRHIEERAGMVNFSIVGRNAAYDQRAAYIEWDYKTKERQRIATNFNKRFPHLEAQIGGETGLDIFEKGKSKAQIRQFLNGKIIFIGDACFPNGNDWALVKALNTTDIWHEVKSYHDTWNILKENYVV